MASKKQRVIVDAKGDEDGDITHVKFRDNQNWTPADTAILMAERGEIKNTHVVHPSDGRRDHLRTNPNRRTSDNLDDMAGDT